MEKSVLVRNNVKVLGKGKQPVLFAHGFGCDQNMFRYIIPGFLNDYQVILFDYVGAGHSDIESYHKDRYSSLYGYTQDLLEIIGALNLNDIIFVGHSVSSMIGLLAALDQPRLFRALIMIGPSPCYINKDGYTGGFEKADIEGLLQTMDQNYIGWANFLAPAIMGNKDRPELAEELTESFCSTDPVIARQFAEVTFLSDNRADLSRLKVPSLILQCAEDIIAPAAVGEYLHHNMPGSTLKYMKATGHCPQLSEPEETLVLIKDYLKNIE